MDVTPLIKSDAQVIQSYAGGRFRVSGQVYEGAIIVSPGHTKAWSKSGGMSDIVEADFEQLVEDADEIDVVLLGCGARIGFLEQVLKDTLKSKGLNIETMDTGAACRTYNVLMAEGRRVAAALLPV